MDLSKAIIRLVKKTPILASIIYKFDIKSQSDPRFIAGVDVQSNPEKMILHFNYNWSKNLNVKFENELEEAETNAIILLHEILHIFLLHPLRREECRKIFQKYNMEYNHKLVNIAADYAVNAFIVNHIYKKDLPRVFNPVSIKELFESSGEFNPEPGKLNILYDVHVAANASMEEILKVLIERTRDDSKQNNSNSDGDNNSNNNGDNSAVGFDDHAKMYADSTNPNNNKVIEGIKQIVSAVANEMRNAGELPGDVDNYINIKINKKDWKLPLLMRLNSISLKSRLAYPNKRNLYNDYVLPRFYRIKKSEVVVSLDVSGSISENELSYFAGELLKLIKKDYIIKYCIMHDSKIQRVITHEELENELKKGKIKVTGRGGTDFRPVFEYLAEHDCNPACLIMFTDCEGPFPNKPADYPVIALNVAYKNNKNKKIPNWVKEIKYEI